jgi:hypothetical protein
MKYSPQTLTRMLSDNWQSTIGKLIISIEDELRRVANLQEGADRVAFSYEVNRGYVNGGSLPASYYYAGFGAGTALTTGAPTANVLRAIPFIAPGRGGVIDQLAFNVTALVAASTARIGLYASKSETNIYPGTLLHGSGAIGTAANGVKTESLKVQLDPLAVYWLALVSSANPTLRCGAVAGCTVPSILPDAAAMPTTRSLGLSVAFPYAALPNTFPAGAAYITAVPVPVLAYRFSA